MDKTIILLKGLSLVAILIAVLYIHMDLGRKWAIRKVIAQLHSWIAVNGIIRDIVATGTAGNNKFWRASYTFRLNETEYPGNARCNTVRGGSAPYYSGQQVCLLVDPDNPEHCRLKDDMRGHSFMLIKSDDLKSIKRVRIEFVIDCLIALASAAGIVVLDIVYSYTHGAAVLFYLIVAGVLFLLGKLQMIEYTPNKLFNTDTQKPSN